MPIPAGYTQLTTGFWRKDSDLSGPYAWTGAAFYLISTGVAGSGVPADYTQHPSGFWFKTADGSGPYSYDGTDFWLAGNGGPSGAITVATVNVSSAINMSNGSTFNLYNTPDQTTNYERLRASFISNRAEVGTFFAGTGTPRQLRVGAGTASTLSSFLGFYSQQFPFIEAMLPNTASSGVLVELFKGTFTGSAGTQTIASIQPTLNQSGTAGYTALDINPTETTTGSGTKLLQRWAVGGAVLAQMNNGGFFGAAAGVVVGNSGGIGFASGLSSATQDVYLARDAADTLALRRDTNAQTFRVYNRYTDASNYERGIAGWISNTYAIGTFNAGTGANRPIGFYTNSLARWVITADGHFLANDDNTYDIGASGANRPRNLHLAGSGIAAGYFQTTATAVGSLPAAASGNRGARWFVTDSSVAAAGNYGAIVAGGGANIVPVYSDGTNWRIG